MDQINNQSTNTPIENNQVAQPNLVNNIDNQNSTAEWLKSLDSDAQLLIKNKGWKSPNDLAKGYMNIEKVASSKNIVQPKDDASEAEWNAYFEKLGRPKKSDEYKFSKPENAEYYDEGLATQFRNVAHKLGLTSKQAAALHDELAVYMNNTVAEQIKVTEANTAEIEANLRQKWGAGYTDKIKQAKVVADKLFGDDQELVHALHNRMGVGFYEMLVNYANGNSDPKIKMGSSSSNGYNLTPAEAKASISKLMGDPIFVKKWIDKMHPEHDQAVADYNRYVDMLDMSQ